MKVILFRHLIAENRLNWNAHGYPDQLRPLMNKGISSYFQMIKFFKKLVPQIDIVVASQYVRSVQSAHLLIRDFPEAKLFMDKRLNPLASIKEMKLALQHYSDDNVICFVGHEPELSRLGHALSPDFIEQKIKKGSFLMLDKDGDTYRLEWQLNLGNCLYYY